MPEECEMKEWTVMFVFATDNPLAPGTILQLKAIKNAGYHPDVNVIAQFDPHTVGMPVHIFDVNLVEKALNTDGKPDIGFTKNDPFVRNLVLDKLWDADVKEQVQENLRNRRNGGQPKEINYDPPVPTQLMSSEQDPKESLATFLDFCRINYPARHYILIILGHGVVVGNDLFMLDDNAGDDSTQHSLKLADLGEVLGKFKDRIGRKCEFELLGFHSCSMSAVEVAFQLKGTANYMLASEGNAYVGSWPYRQMLIRLFNDVEESSRAARGEKDEKRRADLDANAIAACLVDTLKCPNNEVAAHLASCFSKSDAKLLKQHQVGVSPQKELVKAFEGVIKKHIDGPPLSTVKVFQNGNVTASPRAQALLKQHKTKKLQGHDLRQLNRQLLMDAFPDEIKRAKNRRMFIKFFDYCSFNGFDFQLAGYTSDLTLCDLNRVGQLSEPVAELARTLRKGLKQATPPNDPAIREAILLAHWESQSYFEENYSDLYDFCFRLSSKYQLVGGKSQDARQVSQETRETMDEIINACKGVMDALKRGFLADDFGPVVRCRFSGPTYQFSHGLSVFFPWSEPVSNRMWENEYEFYDFNEETQWRDFLKTYFTETMRHTHDEEKDPRDQPEKPSGMAPALLTLIEEMAARAFADVEQLKGGAKDPLGGGKGGGSDPTGSDCQCNSIKNHPRITRRQQTVIINGKKRNVALMTKKERDLLMGTFTPTGSPDMVQAVMDQFTGEGDQEG